MTPYEIKTSYQQITNMETAYADNIAIQYYDDEKGGIVSIPYRQYGQDIRRCVSWLEQNFSTLKGRHIALLARNSYRYAVCLFAVMVSQAVAVPLNPEKSLPEIEDELSHADIDTILHDGAFGTREPEFLTRHADILLPLDGFEATTTLATLHECENRDALSLLLFTSGTTGRSKGVMLSQKNLFAPMKIFIDIFDIAKEGAGIPLGQHVANFSVLPMFHVAALTAMTSWTLTGQTINLCNNTKYLYRDLQLMPSDYILTVPILMKSFHKDIMKGHKERLGGLRILACGAAMVDPQMFDDLTQNGMFVCQMYGLTEVFGNGTFNPSQDKKYLSSVGKGDPLYEYRLIDGELCIRGDTVMMGYYNDPKETAEALQDGWFHTGDLARQDEEGYFYLTGRKKNLIILSSGENISPEELEATVGKLPSVQEVLVKEKKDKLCAVIFCPAEAQATVRAALTELNRTLPLYKRITVIEFSDAPLPRTATGKLKRD